MAIQTALELLDDVYGQLKRMVYDAKNGLDFDFANVERSRQKLAFMLAAQAGHGEARKRTAAERREQQPFTIELPGQGPLEVVGWDAVIEVTGLLESSLRTRLSSGQGEFIRRSDGLRVVRGAMPPSEYGDVGNRKKAQFPKKHRDPKPFGKKRGRPKKELDVDRLGSEAAWAPERRRERVRGKENRAALREADATKDIE